jgi:hypothetical protein
MRIRNTVGALAAFAATAAVTLVTCATATAHLAGPPPVVVEDVASCQCRVDGSRG